MHTWGGRGHASDCDLTIYPDGSVDIKMGTQDLGTGTRTTILIVASDTLGIPMEASSCTSGTPVSALGGFRRIHYARWCELIHSPRCG